MSFLGAFRSTAVQMGGRLNKVPWRLPATRKENARKRLRAVDEVVLTLRDSGVQLKALDEALARPLETEMNARNKYWVFARNHPGLKKGIHKVPKFTKTELPREFPAGIKSLIKIK
ncbi:hypothetical protein GGF31_001921 [Allomyces arbusculus]|nr:hypothetical protein GGF31_001921 [Allomyces arbusculus]